MNYILEGSYSNGDSYFSSDSNLFDIATEAVMCYRDKEVHLTSAIIEDYTWGVCVGNDTLLNAFHEIVGIDEDYCCDKIYLLMEKGPELEYNRYKGIRFYVVEGSTLEDALHKFNNDMSHDVILVNNTKSLIVVDTIHC